MATSGVMSVKNIKEREKEGKEKKEERKKEGNKRTKIKNCYTPSG